jgi:transcriptional regulator GlxA family with amidase domain
MGQYWRGLTVFVHRELALRRPTITEPLVLAQTETMLAAAALAVFPNITLTAAAPPRSGHVGPAPLRRAVDYIETHADQPITLSDIANGAGVGTRALHDAFVRHLESTPMRYLRQVRLERAHRELQTADPARGDSVEKIALRWGFANTGRFTESYRRAYGVNPSRTLRT